MALSEFPGFRARWPWLGADLQTVRNQIVPPPALDAGPAAGAGPASETLTFPMEDGTGDRLTGILSRPPESDHSATRKRVLIVLVHGLAGCCESAYMRESGRSLLAAGYPVLRLNLRGSLPTLPWCREQYHAGRTDDLRRVFRTLSQREEAADGLVAVGFSLGGGMVLNYLAERHPPDLIAGVSVSAPLNLAAASERFLQPRNRLYHAWLMRLLRRDALGLRDLDAAQAKAVRHARTLFQFDDRITAPRNGFRDARDYYRRSSAAQRLGDIRTPTLIIHARDDPWIPHASYGEVDWAGNRFLTPALTRHGGHVGFHDRDGTWHNRIIRLFLADHGFC